MFADAYVHLSVRKLYSLGSEGVKTLAKLIRCILVSLYPFVLVSLYPCVLVFICPAVSEWLCVMLVVVSLCPF